MQRSLHSAGIRRATLWAVMAALLIAQTLGLLHRIVHAPQAAHSGLSALAAAPQIADHTHAAAATPADTDWLERLFGTHEPTGCESYDQLSHADFLWSCAAPPTVQATSTGVPLSHPGWQLAAQAAGYLARGPPKLS